MILIIDGKKAVVKSGSSFEYISENRAFTDSDAYTLSITLPMAGCAQNQMIFGHIARMDAESRVMALDASLIEGEFHKTGVVSVVEATETEIKVQFLEGRSVQNFTVDYDEVYINELDLGSFPTDLPASPSYPTCDMGADYVPFQWVNDSAEGFLNNEIDSLSEWAESTVEAGKLSYMPYLLFLTKKICDAAGFTFDFSPWENSDDRYLLVCNAIPAAWDLPEIARILPHWSFPEFFTQLERFLVCEFDIDYKAKNIRMTYTKDVKSLKNTVKIDNIVDDFSSEISYKDYLCKYRSASRITYADRGDSKWKFDSCSWFIELMMNDPSRVMKFADEDEYKTWFEDNKSHFGATSKDGVRGIRGKLFHIVSTNTNFIWHVVPMTHRKPYLYFKYSRINLNRFADFIYDIESDETVELKMVPARIDYLSDSKGEAVFLAPSAYNETEDIDDNDIRQPFGFCILQKGDEEQSPEYYDKLMLAVWDGSYFLTSQPHPSVDERFSLKNKYDSYMNGIKIKPKEKIMIKFISDTMPDVRSIFNIRGKLYLCEKITATFNDDGMSQLMKGEFYPIAD